VRQKITSKLQKLIESGCELDSRDVIGCTALYHCFVHPITASSLRMAHQLVLRGADINLQNRIGETALTRAVVDKNLDGVKLLVEFGASPMLVDHHGFSPWKHADENIRKFFCQTVTKIPSSFKRKWIAPERKFGVRQCFFVIDTNVLIDNLNILKRLQLITWCSIKMVIPLTVIRELDGKKHDPDNKVAQASRKARDWLKLQLKRNDPGMEFETKDEECKDKENLSSDDVILSCADRKVKEYLHIPDVVVLFVTWDKILQLNAIIHGVPLVESTKDLENPSSERWVELFHGVRKKEYSLI
jgi:rRNA-processing protein FCF1